MVFSCDRKTLLAAVKRTAKAAASSSKVEILTGILLSADAENYELFLAATDLNLSITCTVAAPVVRSGRAVVSAKLFAEMLSLLGGQTVEVQLLPQNQLGVSSGSTRYRIACLPADDFPVPQFSEPAGEVEISRIKSLAKQTVFAAAKTGSSVMQCIRLELTSDSLRAVGCDGNILSSVRRQSAGSGSAGLLIPASALSLLAGLTGDEETLLLSSDGKQAVFRSPEQGMTFAIRLGVGSYLDVDSVLSCVSKQYEAIVDATMFRDALDHVNALTEPGSSLVNLVFSLGLLSLSCESAAGSAKNEIPAQVTAIMPPEGFCYQSKKLLQGIQTMTGPIQLTVSDTGLLLVSGGEQSFFQAPSKKQAAKAAKKSRTKKKTAKAA